ncbi:cation:proton antiporter domain-containing protein [Flavihumibacter petaseus]|uniref:Putative CPA2 family transporter n=1 Tax=Flavihumibacter petaseus NBRC 106054 TaxID=1220578 RepID=A0A0E9N1I0_9BACT|nr:cation:proton antiporter [Flavihumibacter petaseus]GAO43633.1 putative CPA2 family transporter [Flavihumibacter petaseus NBRC 106054]
MAHLPKLIEDLALILFAAAITTLIFKKLRQPLVLGYILAGLLVGPHISIVPTVVDRENINILAEIGVVFLLFSLGLEFSFKKLARVGGTASITAIFEIFAMLGIGYGAGILMGWSKMDAIFLGGILSISSTTIIIRAFEELGLKNKQFARVVFGVLIVEDLVAIVLLVLLSTLAMTQHFAGAQMLYSVGRLVFFLALWFLAGIFVLPTLLRRIKGSLTNETLLILALGLCLAMVVLATHTGFSPALGAFVMGSILAETTLAEKIEHLVMPVKDLFAAVFFVSVGILIDPKSIVDHAGPVAIITFLTIFGKFLSSSIGAVISGQPLRQSIQTGFSLAQIGEFSFIIAQLGLTLGVTSDFLYPIAVAVSAITTFTTPYLIKASGGFYVMLESVLPKRFLRAVDKYASGTRQIQAESDWKQVLRAYGMIIGGNSVIAIAIIVFSGVVIGPLAHEHITPRWLANVLLVVVTLLITAPFFWGLMVRKPRSMAFKDLWLDKKYNRGPLLLIEIGRNVLGVLIFGLLVDRLFSGKVAALSAFLVFIVVMIIFSKKLQSYYARIEHRFLRNLNARENAKDEKPEREALLSPWDAHLATMTVSPEITGLGKTLEELAWRETYGINVASIDRGTKMIHIPARTERIFPHDKLSVIGTDMQLQMFRAAVEINQNDLLQLPEENEDIELVSIIVDEHNHLKGQSIRSSNIRERTDGLVVGIERDARRMLNPDSYTVFEWGDVVWIVGNRRKILSLSHPVS